MRQVLSLSPFDADPAVVFFDVDLDGGEAGTVENGFKGFRCRVIEVVVFDVFLNFSAEAVVAVDFGDEQEGSARFEDAAYFFQVFWWIRPEIEAFDGRNLIEGVVRKGQGFDGAFTDGHFSSGYVGRIRLARGLDRRRRIIDPGQMACCDVGAHTMEIGPTAAADVQDLFVAVPLEMGQAPSRKGRMAFIHACQHLLAGFPRRFGRIASRRNSFLSFFFCISHDDNSFRNLFNQMIPRCSQERKGGQARIGKMCGTLLKYKERCRGMEANMMNDRMPVGIDDFQKVREGYYFVDKTDFIKDLIDSHGEVTLLTRPRRFGKTLTMSMLDWFFSAEKEEESRELFQGLHIASAGAEYMNHRGQYPVIFLTLKGVQNDAWKSLYDSFCLLMQSEYERHDYLLDSGLLKTSERAYYRRILDLTGSEADYQVSLLYLSHYLRRKHDRPTIILIDEYDAPIQCAYNHGFYDKAISYFRIWFNNALKSNTSLSFAVLTGVLRIVKESIFSGLNNLKVCSVLTRMYADVMGFTSDEIRKMAQDLDMEAFLPDIQTWYDGYHFGNQDIYNPWSVINFFDQKTLDDYWINTSGNSILNQLMLSLSDEKQQDLLSLLRGDSVAAMIREGIIYDEIGNDEDALYTMLLTTGYLTPLSCEKALGGYWCELVIPNREIQDGYRFEIINRYRMNLSVGRLTQMIQALVNGKTEKFSAILEQYITYFVSTYDAAHKESFYHGFLLGMTALFINDYEVVSNQESGYGRFDLALFPRNHQRSGVVLEFKVAAEDRELESKAVQALEQIENKQYAAAFRKKGIQKVWKYGISFCGKKICVKRAE